MISDYDAALAPNDVMFGTHEGYSVKTEKSDPFSNINAAELMFPEDSNLFNDLFKNDNFDLDLLSDVPSDSNGKDDDDAMESMSKSSPCTLYSPNNVNHLSNTSFNSLLKSDPSPSPPLQEVTLTDGFYNYEQENLFDLTSMDTIMGSSSKHDDDELPSEPMDVVAGVSTISGTMSNSSIGGSASATTGLTTTRSFGDISPTYSHASDSSTDSGMSSDDTSYMSSSTRGIQLSPVPEYTSSVTSSPTPPPSSQLSPDEAASTSPTSGYSSSSPSPPSSPESPSSHDALLPHPSTLSYTISSVTESTSNRSPASSGVQQVSATPQFYVQKRAYNGTLIGTTSAAVRTLNTSSAVKPNTIVSLSSPAILRQIPSTNKLNPIILNNSQLLPRTASTVASSSASGGIVRKASSLSPPVVTLSGVNKTAGICKSPLVNNSLRKVVTSSSPSIVVTKPVSVITSPGKIVSSTSTTGLPVFKTVTSTAKVGTFKGANVAAHRIIKSTNAQNNDVYYIADKNYSPIHTLKLVPSNSDSKPNVLKNTSLRTFVTANRRSLNGTSAPNSIRTTTILKGIPLSSLRSTSSSDGGVSSSSNGLLLTPKEELDSDDDYDMPKNNQPLILTDEEKKLAQKEKIKFPSHYPLNKSQERDLKRIRRKIRNKISAQDSRKRKKEQLDRLEAEIKETRVERDLLKEKVALLEESERTLLAKLKKVEAMMSCPQLVKNNTSSSSSSNNNSSSSSTNNKHQYPSTLLFMMALSIALFVYPSLLPQGKQSELLTDVVQKMPPAAGNTRSLLEAAATKLSACQDEDADGAIVDATVDCKVSTALTDHDYIPAAKRARLELPGYKDFCLPLIDEQYNSPPVKKKEQSSSGEEEDGGGTPFDWGDGETSESIIASTSQIKSSSPSLLKSPLDKKNFFEEGKVEMDSTLGSITTMLKSIEEKLANWTESKEDKAAVLDVFSPSVVVKLAAAAAGGAGHKRFHEDVELE